MVLWRRKFSCTVRGQDLPDLGSRTVGVIKNGPNDWTMALHPGALGRRETPDMSKLIKLDSDFSDSKGVAEHLIFDINAGSGKFEGKAVAAYSGRGLTG